MRLVWSFGRLGPPSEYKDSLININLGDAVYLRAVTTKGEEKLRTWSCRWKGEVVPLSGLPEAERSRGHVRGRNEAV